MQFLPFSYTYVCRYPAIDFQDLSYYSAPKQKSEKVSIMFLKVALEPITELASLFGVPDDK